MLKKIKLIQGIGNFTKTTARGIDLGDVTIIYGENRNGKSTLWNENLITAPFV